MMLSGCRVVEVGEYVAVPYAGKLLSDLGADVWKIESPDGDLARRVGPFLDDSPGVERSEFFGYLNTGKRSVTVPPAGATSGDFIHDLIREEAVDLVIEDRLTEYGIDSEDLADGFEDVSVVSVTDFGATGPWQEYEAPDIVGWAESGHMNKMGYPDNAPTRLGLKAIEYWTGQVAAITGLAALLDTLLQDAPGQHVDLAKREVGVSTMEHFIAAHSWTGGVSHRSGHGYPSQGDEEGFPTIWETKDGHVSASVTDPGRWEVFCEEFVGKPELAEDERFATQAARQNHRQEVRAIIEEYIATQEKWPLFERFLDHHIPAAVNSTVEDVADLDHLEARKFWSSIPLPSGEPITMPGFPFLVNGERPEQHRPPILGEHNEVYRRLGYEYIPSTGTLRYTDDRDPSQGFGESHEEGADRPLPLAGIKVLDFSWVYAGPHASKYLAALGADVVKVESEQKPDEVRALATYDFDSTPTSNVSAYFNEHNQGKRSLQLDLTNDRGYDLAVELIEEADVVMENFSPSFMERVGLTYEDVREIDPAVVYLSMPGWGKSGPAKDYGAYGFTIQSMAGLNWISGFPDDPPTTSGHSWPDPTGGFMGAFGVLAALRNRERTGEGTYIESALYEVTVSMMHKPLSEYVNNGRQPERLGNRDEDRRFVQGAYPCDGEDDWAVIAIGSDEQWSRLCEVIGRPELTDDDRFASQYDRLQHHDAVDEVIAEWTRERTREEVRTRLQHRDVPAGIVADERDLVEYDPQLRARQYFTTHDHPEVGERTYQGVPFVMAPHDVTFQDRAPLFGEHTEEVLAEWLDMNDDDIRDAADAGALY